MTDYDPLPLIWLAIAWLAYGLLHSVLASLGVKAWLARRVPAVMPWYRLTYNLLAVVTALPMVWLILRADGPYLLYWPGPWRWLGLGLAAAALGAFVLSLRAYDLGEFSGLKQIHERREGGHDAAHVMDHDRLAISFFHRFVRHPWYFFGMVMLWTQNMQPALLVSALVITLYTRIGAHFEEKKLIAQYGDAYRRYMARVPAIVPCPWKYLSAREAEEIAASA